ncbi:MAG TPA: PD-(D/E)XK nuclease family protein, partial [Polyangiaceae bacterium]|nr:PD-(D/E)XK nuclease family protein [Polyangiaceae bacterium]
LTVNARQLLDVRHGSRLLRPPRQVEVERAELPGGLAEWHIGSVELGVTEFSATSLAALLACPLRWVLSYPAKLRTTRRRLPPIHQLVGTLGHRLMELLHQQGAFDLPELMLEERARAELDALLSREGALLSRPGMSFERAQVAAQLVRAVVELARSLRHAQLRVLAVEQPLRRPWRCGELEGRIDVLVGGLDGEHIIDLKYGASSYRDALKEGRALQLAVYGALHAHGRERPTEAAFFSLKQAQFVGLEPGSLPVEHPVRGRSLAETWAAVERIMDPLEGRLSQGRVPVTGLRRSLPLLDSLGIEQKEQRSCFAASRDSICEYCQLDVLCGRRWEGERERG